MSLPPSKSNEFRFSGCGSPEAFATRQQRKKSGDIPNPARPQFSGSQSRTPLDFILELLLFYSHPQYIRNSFFWFAFLELYSRCIYSFYYGIGPQTCSGFILYFFICGFV